MKKYVLSLGLIVGFVVMAAGGGGWPQPKGKGYFKLFEWWMVSDQHYTDAGLLDPNITTGFFSTAVYGEYGFTDRITAILYAPLFVRTYTNNQISMTTGDLILAGEAINGIGDMDISIKYGLTPGRKISTTATLTLGLPFGQSSGGTQGNLQIGDGEFNQILTFDAGTGWILGQNPMYGNVSVGFNNRTNGFSDEWRIGVEMGIQLFEKKLWMIGRIKVLESLKNEPPAGLQNNTSLFANNTEFTAYELEASYNVSNNWGVSVGFGGAFRGELILANPAYTVGVFMTL